jgi:hypothetical protein
MERSRDMPWEARGGLIACILIEGRDLACGDTARGLIRAGGGSQMMGAVTLCSRQWSDPWRPRNLQHSNQSKVEMQQRSCLWV